jgi:hypothetical protein
MWSIYNISYHYVEQIGGRSNARHHDLVSSKEPYEQLTFLILLLLFDSRRFFVSSKFLFFFASTPYTVSTHCEHPLRLKQKLSYKLQRIQNHLTAKSTLYLFVPLVISHIQMD